MYRFKLLNDQKIGHECNLLIMNDIEVNSVCGESVYQSIILFKLSRFTRLFSVCIQFNLPTQFLFLDISMRECCLQNNKVLYLDEYLFTHFQNIIVDFPQVFYFRHKIPVRWLKNKKTKHLLKCIQNQKWHS